MITRVLGYTKALFINDFTKNIAIYPVLWHTETFLILRAHLWSNVAREQI